MTPRRLGLPVLAGLAALLLAGCGDSGGLEGAGPTPTAVGPRHLWPSMTPASAPADDYGAGETQVVKGVAVPDGDLRKVNPVAVIRAQAAADPDTYEEVEKGLPDCGDPGPKGPGCPVLHTYYADLTGNGKADMVVGVRAPKGQLVVRVYMYADGKLTQIMDDEDAVISVQLADRSLVVRAVADLSGYEYRTSWSYDSHQRAMLPTRDEIVRTGPPTTPVPETPSEDPTPPPSASPAAPSASPSAAAAPSPTSGS
ncbi:hypothetical protein OKJ48_03905 [Streptomyces kunmingensis]|uniref:Lipoprotein n=1 Tax=Streptomyces kunmingensis TaxID=68225 RepID=A0ABU6C4C0_9ACTN|nr:hypothetical protein [Streptomyces kunmingensis]MEB3959398.1 hypothetical protein [Streptomyces kunmingensis]